jgi:hypothetical protein
MVIIETRDQDYANDPNDTLTVEFTARENAVMGLGIGLILAVYPELEEAVGPIAKKFLAGTHGKVQDFASRNGKTFEV